MQHHHLAAKDIAMSRSIRFLFLPVMYMLALVAPLRAQTASDSAAIRATALDYIEGWYTADAARMERALHPHLAKRFLERRADGGVQLTETSALELVQQVRNGGGAATPDSVRRTDVRILDIFQNVASVRVDAHGWIDYMHMGKVAGRWRIVNVLWEIREVQHRPMP
jgi:hypothetical protein